MTLKQLDCAGAAAFISTLALTVQAQTSNTLSTLPQKPVWLTELSVGVKEGYDDNVFLAGVTPPAGDAVQPGSANALKNKGSWVTTISPKIGVDFAPLLGQQTAFESLLLAYVPDLAFYHNAPTENNEANRFLTTIKGESDPLGFDLDNTFLYVHGDKYGPTYPGDFISAFGIAAPRERREQIQDRAAVSIQYDMGNWFVRPAASLIFYDLMTEHIANAALGYLNYVNRSDVNGGADLGYNISHTLALTVGYRYGYQYQQELFDNPTRSCSTYQRALLGLEGQPWKWLNVKIQGGPDFRDYADYAPVNDKHRITYYGEAALAVSISPQDTVTFKYKGWQWVSCIGYVPYFESVYDLKYHRKVTEKLGLDLGAKIATADYDMGNIIARDDLLYTVSVGVDYAFNSHASINVAYQVDLGRSGENAPNNVPEDQFDRQMVTLGAALKF